MRRVGLLGAVCCCAVLGCTSTRMLQREGCWVKQTEKWPSRVSEELGFCTKPAPVWAQDRVARLVQECMAQADFRWQNRAIAAWTRGDPIPPQESDDKIAQTCMNEASAALRQEAENSALKSRLAEVSQDRESLRTVSEGDREFLKQSSDKMVSALGEAAKKPAPAAVATATSTGTAKTESDLRTSDQPPVQSAPATVVEVHGAPAQPAQPAPVLVTPRTVIKPSEGCAQARKPAVRRGTGSKLPADEPACPKTAQPPGPVSMGPVGAD
ncbi:MAG TPA: hypothetical protein VKC58_05970 [Myxococcales bacterium]|nr:hypothetical protein [Myxococcales bacterium]